MGMIRAAAFRSWNIRWNRGRSRRLCIGIGTKMNTVLYLKGGLALIWVEKIVLGDRGDLIFKPRNQWHTFWNAGDEPARILEIISPAGFERYFVELAGCEPPFDPEKVLALAARYDVELDFGSIPHLIKEHGVTFSRCR